jgi:hypothetical protein
MRRNARQACFSKQANLAPHALKIWLFDLRKCRNIDLLGITYLMYETGKTDWMI